MKKRKGQAPNANEAQLRAAARYGMDKTMVYCLTTLSDKMGFTREQLLEVIGGVASLSESVMRGYINYDDLHRVLVEEQGLEWGK